MRSKSLLVPAEPKLVAITSPYGSTGKTTLTINLAAELSKAKQRVLVIDCDGYGPAIDAQLGLPGGAAGLSAAARIANQDRFDLAQLNRLTTQVRGLGFSVLSGTADSNRSQGIELESVAKIIETAKGEHDFILLDLGSLGLTSSVPSNLLTEQLMAQSDFSIVVTLADPIGIYRLLAIEEKLLKLGANYKIVINRLRNSVLPNAKAEITETFARLSAFEISGFLPEDPVAIDQSVREAVPAVSLSRPGAFKQAIAGYVRGELLNQTSRLDSRLAKLG
ncbi:MAG: CpaE family protein [Actinomycetota bacterium]